MECFILGRSASENFTIFLNRIMKSNRGTSKTRQSTSSTTEFRPEPIDHEIIQFHHEGNDVKDRTLFQSQVDHLSRVDYF